MDFTKAQTEYLNFVEKQIELKLQYFKEVEAMLVKMRPILEKAAGNRKLMQVAQPARQCLSLMNKLRDKWNPQV